MTNKPNPISRHFHEDWQDNRYDMLQGDDLRKANAEMQAENNKLNEHSNANPSDLMRGIEAEQAMSRSEARDWKYQQEQSYRR